MQTNIDDLVNQFRLASRDIQNRYFYPKSGHESDSIHSFRLVEETLFTEMVLRPAGLDINHKYGFPTYTIGVAFHSSGVAAMINRVQGDSSGYWDNETKTIENGSTLVFSKYFDFNQYGYIDNSFVTAYILDSACQPEISSYYALIRREKVGFFLRQVE